MRDVIIPISKQTLAIFKKEKVQNTGSKQQDKTYHKKVTHIKINRLNNNLKVDFKINRSIKAIQIIKNDHNNQINH